MTDRADLPDRAREDHGERVSQPESLREDERDRRGTGTTEHPAVPSGPPSDEKKRRRSPWVLIGVGMAVVLIALGGGWYWWSTRDLQSTDDAYTDGNAVSIAPHVSGFVTSLEVNDNQHVVAGQTLLQIDPRDYAAARDQAAGNLRVADGQLENARISYQTAQVTEPARLATARAQLQTAQANLTNAQSDFTRQHSVSRAATTQQNVDQSTASLRSAQAQVAQAEAQVRQADIVPQLVAQAAAQVHQLEGQVAQAQAQLTQAELNLSWTRVTAPQDGWVAQRRVQVGNLAQQGQPVLSLVTPQIWVTGNFKESQLDRMRPGQSVGIAVDAYPSLRLSGHVDSIQPGSGAQFSAFPAENATGNFVKIVRRVPVKILIDAGLDPKLPPLPLGLSVTPTVHLQ